MSVMLERWNDDKMDALEHKVDDLGDQMREQRGEMHELRREVRQEIGGMRQEMDGLRQEMKVGFERMHRTLLSTVIGMTSGVLAGFAALIVLIATLH